MEEFSQGPELQKRLTAVIKYSSV